ncbi:cysteine hydrolase family protein [Streptomyces sp. NPDC001914]|uniref:cysteine hydrolase family protein n=1 Tax=Streptomyces sp. NPDC001914 TaxID=3364623 RepID=UPI00369C31DB
MTTLPDRPNTALLVIDMQHGAVDGAHDLAGVIANIEKLVARARAEAVPVIWVQHSDGQMKYGSESWQYVPELVREEAEPVVHKNWGDSFEATDLEDLLAERAVGHVVVTGAQTDMCVRSTLHSAFTRGYDVTLVGDAHTTEDLTAYGAPAPADVVAHTNLYWREQRAPGRRGDTVETADVTFAARVAG